MAIELELTVFEAMWIDFGLIFELKIDIHCRISNVFDFDFLLLNIIKGNIEV